MLMIEHLELSGKKIIAFQMVLENLEKLAIHLGGNPTKESVMICSQALAVNCSSLRVLMEKQWQPNN